MNEYRNDAVHPTLSRALPIAQTTLDGRGPGRDHYGRCEVLEATGAGGFTDFTFGATVTGVAWSVNPYSGCAHACTYCYVPDTIKAERHRWGTYSIVKKDLPTRLARAIARTGKKTVYFSTSTDPYQPLEAEHRITRRCLEVLARKDWPVEILTRSPLVVRDLELFRQFSNIRVGFSIPMLDDEVRHALEPSAPTIPARIRALRTLADEGIATFANYTPACPPTTHDAGQVAKAFLDAGAQWVNSKGLQRKESTLVPMWDRLHGTRWEDLTRFLASEKRQAAWHQELGAAFRKIGLPLSTPFFNPPFEFPELVVRPEQTRLDAVRIEVPLVQARRKGKRAGPAVRRLLPVLR